MKLVAKTFAGCESLLAEELNQLGASEITPLIRAVSFEGDLALLYKSNLHCRTALRILKPIYEFDAPDEASLYKGVQEIDWSQYLENESTFAINSTLSQSNLTHSQFVSQKAKDAIADQFRAKTGKRPSVDLEYPDLRINLHMQRNRCSIAFDSSGDALYKRGYRELTNQAPLNEAMAAALVMMTGWDGSSPLVDFMCGSGTLLIEAAMIKRNIAPGKWRTHFGFQNWKDYDKSLWNKIYDDAVRAEKPADGISIYGSDISHSVVRKAQENIDQARLSDTIEVQQGDMRYFKSPAATGMLLSNPPYGLRIEPRDILELYRSMGDTLKQRLSGWTCWIFTGNLDAAKHIGLRPSRKIPLFNGPVECRLLRFDMYAGSKKTAANPA